MLCVGNNASAAARRCMKRAKMNPLAASERERERATLKNTEQRTRDALQRATEATPSKNLPLAAYASLSAQPETIYTAAPRRL